MDNNEQQPDLDSMRHTAAHVLAAASTKLRPETRLGVGPATDDGFYHDIDVDENYTEEDLKKLEKEMKKIQKMNLPIEQKEVSKDEARELFAHDPYKLELIDELEGDTVGVSDMGDGFFVTLCKGGHVSSTKHIGYFKLTRMAGVYWKGDANRQQLQRIYGVLFPTKEELNEHLHNLEEAKKRDHRKLGQELDLFTFSPLVGSGLPLFTPRGTVIRNELQNTLVEISKKYGMQPVSIPHIAKKELYDASGHSQKFGDELLKVTSHYDEFVMKPVNCPHHTQIYASRPRSYRDLPLRYMETSMQYRDEKPGEIGGLTRVRAITVDDGHIFCRLDQVKTEAENIIRIIEEFYTNLGLYEDKWVSLSVRDPQTPDAYIGNPEDWDKAEKMLEEIADETGLNAKRIEGEAAIYGPKLDFMFKDSLGREWQLATVQLDFNMPNRFNLTYTDNEGNEQTPVMIHRAILGSYERFMAILIEHYAGALPLWLSPLQATVLPIADDHNEYANQVAEQLSNVGIRTEVDTRRESIGKKIREAQLQKVPYMLVVGQKEMDEKTVSVRSRQDGDEGSLSLEDVTTKIQKQIKEKA